MPKTYYHVTNARIPHGLTDKDPMIFDSLSDAVLFSRIVFRRIFALTAPGKLKLHDRELYEIYPGGRVVRWAKPK